MKKNIKGLSLIAVAIALFVSTICSLCYASGIAIGDESVTLRFYGEESGVYFLITDPKGRRTGYDPASGQEIEEFPAAFGFSFEVRDEIHEAFDGEAVFNLIPGTYTIEVLGVALTEYSVNISISRRLPGQSPTGVDIKTLNFTPEQISAIKSMNTQLNFKGIIDKGLTAKFQITYTSDPDKPAGTATKIVEPSNLKQDIMLSRKLNWIFNDGIMNSLLKKADAAEASMAKGNKEAARNQLNAFVHEVKALKDKQILDKAAKILIEDAQYLLEKL